MGLELIESPDDTAAFARVSSNVMRWLVLDAAEVEHRRRVTTRRDWLAVLDGEPVGAASCVVVPGHEEDPAAGASILVERHARHRGVGGRLYREVSDAARAYGRSELELFGF